MRCGAESESGERPLLVLGIGNAVRSDDGVGVHVLRSLHATASSGSRVRWIEGGTLGLALLEPIERCGALIVVDAAELGRAPGSLCVLEGDALDRFLEAAAPSSAHELGLGALRTAALLRGSWPARRALIGIQPGSLEWGTSLSPALQRAVPEAAREVHGTIARWSA